MESLVEKFRLSFDFLELYVEVGDILGIGIFFENKRFLNIFVEFMVDWVDIKLVMFGNYVSWVKNNNVMIVDSVIKELENIFVELLNIVEGNFLGELKDFGK